MNVTGTRCFSRKDAFILRNADILQNALILLFILLLLTGCSENDAPNSNTVSTAIQPAITDFSDEAEKKNKTNGQVIPFTNIIRIPSETAKDFSDEQAARPEYLFVEEISHGTTIYDVRYKESDIIYSHTNGDNDAITVYNVTERLKCDFPSKTSLRRFIRFVSFDKTGYGYLTTFEHEPYTWQYFRFDSLHGITDTIAFDMQKVISKETGEIPVYQSDVEEEGNLFAWIEETGSSGAAGRLLYICILNDGKPELVHTIKLNRGVNTLTPLTIKDQCISYVDYDPDTEKWYIRTYDVLKGEQSEYSCDFELDAKPESPPMYDRSALAWTEERNGELMLYCYNIQKKEKYLVDKGIYSPFLQYPSLIYVKDGKLFSFDYRTKRKLILFEDGQEKVISGGGNAILPYCLTKSGGKSNLYLLHTVPPYALNVPEMKWVVNREGVLELERQSPFIRTGMDNCAVFYNGLERPGLYVNEMGWPLTGICKVIRAEVKITKSKNVLGADVPEEFTVSHGNKSLTFTGEAVPNAFGDGGASYRCGEAPTLQAMYVKRDIVTDLPDLLDALGITWTLEQPGNIFVIEDDMPYTDIKPVIQTEDTDIDGDDKKDAVGLFMTGNSDVILKINEEDISVFSAHEEQIFGDGPDRYYCNLYVEGNKILVGITYPFTNKYGSTSWLEYYRYESGKLEKIWSSEEILSQKVIVEDYNEDSNCLRVKVGDLLKEIFLSDGSDEEEFLNFTNYLREIGVEEIEMEFVITPDYEYTDYDGDGREEIIARTVMFFGASSFRADYYSVYEFSGEGLRLVDSYFRR